MALLSSRSSICVILPKNKNCVDQNISQKGSRGEDEQVRWLVYFLTINPDGVFVLVRVLGNIRSKVNTGDIKRDRAR